MFTLTAKRVPVHSVYRYFCTRSVVQQKMPFSFRQAIVCRIPESLKDNALRTDPNVEVNLDLARKQHGKFVNTLRHKLNLDVVELPCDEQCPDCVFVCDTAVVHNGVALLTRPTYPSRMREIEAVKHTLLREIGLSVVEIVDTKTHLEAGDVLFTGKEFFVGLSTRSNQAGARALANAFPDYRVSQITVTGNLHLQSMMTMVGPDVICIGSSDHAKRALKEIIQKAEYDYETLTVPDDAAANCVYANGGLIHCSKEEFPESYQVFEDKLSSTVKCYPLNFSELAKVDGGFTCCCLLIGRQKTNYLE